MLKKFSKTYLNFCQSLLEIGRKSEKKNMSVVTFETLCIHITLTNGD